MMFWKNTVCIDIQTNRNVSILVLVDDVLEEKRIMNLSLLVHVSILVLVDDVLEACWTALTSKSLSVSILVLVDDVLEVIYRLY